MSHDSTRRNFLKYGLATASAFFAMGASLSIDTKKGFNLGESKVQVGASEANAMCGSGMNCSGGGGMCGSGMNCSGGGGGGGGMCGSGMNCSGGGGMCGSGMNCGGR